VAGAEKGTPRERRVNPRNHVRRTPRQKRNLLTPRWRDEAIAWTLCAVLSALAASLALRVLLPPGPAELEDVPGAAVPLYPPPPDAQ
jgi:hypothetical protein